MKHTIPNLLAAAAVLAGAPLAQAAPFNPKDAAANPALLVHVDCDAIRDSSFGKSILNQPDVQDKLAAVGAIFDFDFRKQLHGLTVYTTLDHPKDGVLIVYADFDSERLITLAKAADGFHTITNGPHTIYSWIDDKKKANEDGEKPRVYGAIKGHRVVFGQDEKHLADALSVIDGSASSFAGSNGLLAKDSGESILAEGELLKFDFDDPSDKAAIFKMCKSVRVKLSEHMDDMSATIRLETADANTATQVGSIAQGLLAILKLQQDPDALKLANAIAIKQNDSAVAVTLSVPSSELTDIIKEGQKKAEQKKADKEKESESSPKPSDGK
ncbi:MAG TPA: hypothetical protein VGO59_12815 [Verrucomicrobiae bacterium]